VTAEVRGRDIGSLVDEAQAKVAQRVTLPPAIGWAGRTIREFRAARQRLMIVVPLCFALIFLLLLSALGSARDALLVFSAGAAGADRRRRRLWLRDMTFSISAAVGFIALSGIAVLNGLVMLTFIKQLIEEGASKRDAILEAPSLACAPWSSRRSSPRWVSSDGDRDGDRGGGAAAARDRRHWRSNQRDIADTSRPAGSL